jgi:hypothetical protein
MTMINSNDNIGNRTRDLRITYVVTNNNIELYEDFILILSFLLRLSLSSDLKKRKKKRIPFKEISKVSGCDHFIGYWGTEFLYLTVVAGPHTVVRSRN